MNFFEIFRRYAFWSFDFLTGRKILNHHKSIELVINHPSSIDSKLQAENDLSAVLKHATDTTVFYRKHQNYQSLEDFPVINKTIVRESFGNFISDKFSESQLVPAITSGSTGTPFKVYHDKNKKLRNSADTIYFAERAGYVLGEVLIYLKVWVKQNIKNPISLFMENIIPVDVSRLNDSMIENLVCQMESKKINYNIIGYASALEMICKYLDRRKSGRVNARVKSVIAMSETLSEYTRKSIKKYFNASVVSRYSNIENGIMAQQETSGSRDFLINTASYNVEILKFDSDEQVEPGHLGRIVITDLYNYAMPLIRYDTGDIGSVKADLDKTENKYFTSVEGRKMDMLYDTSDNLVSSFPVQFFCEEYPEIIQYQIIQESRKGYTMKINAIGHGIDEKKLALELISFLGKDANIKFDYVAEIPLLSSGKRRIMVNNYRRNG